MNEQVKRAAAGCIKATYDGAMKRILVHLAI
jgi:hypothetical protein